MLRLFRRDTSGGRSGSQLEVSHAGEAYKVALKRVVGARRFTLRVRSATRDVVLTMPMRGSISAAKEFAERHAAWIGARLRRLPQPIPFLPGFDVPFRGVMHRIVHRPTQRLPVVVTMIETECGHGMPALSVGGEEPFVTRRLRDFLKREARRDLEAHVTRYAAQIAKVVRRITVRDTRSRWGSCSSTGNLSFSWRLVFAPKEVMEYVVAHEVAHLRHMNHSPSFWSAVERICSGYEPAKVWLRLHGKHLYRFNA